jgi:hypothetical protein
MENEVDFVRESLGGSNKKKKSNENSENDDDEYYGNENRRKSFLGLFANTKLNKINANNKSSAGRASETYIRTEPDKSHIMLKSLTVSNVEKFWKSIEKYEKEHPGTVIRAAIRIDEKVVNTLISYALASDRMDEDLFSSQTNSYVANLIQVALRPLDKTEYLKKLKENTNCEIHTKNDYIPSSSNYYPMFLALQEYRRNFESVYDIISTGLPEKYLPACNNKEDGLIKVFLSKIPFDHGNKIHQNFPANKKWEKISLYLEDFYSEVGKLFEKNKENKAIENLFDHTKNINKNNSSGLTNNNNNFNNKFTDKNKNNNSGFSTPYNKNYNSRGSSVNNLDQSVSSNDILEFEKINNEQLDGEEIYYDNIFSDNEEQNSVKDFMDNPSLSAEKASLTNIQPTGNNYGKINQGQQFVKPHVSFDSNIKKDKKGCWKLILQGTCDSPSCPFEHTDVKILQDTHEILLQLALKSKYSRNNSLRKPSLGNLTNAHEISEEQLQQTGFG